MDPIQTLSMLCRKSFVRAARRVSAAAFIRSPLYRRGHRGKVFILMYHRVLPDHSSGSGDVEPGMYVAETTFSEQMAFISDNYRVISLKDYVDSWEGTALSPSESYAVITFDDGWVDNYRYAFPVLSKLGLPWTIFVPTSLIGTNHWFWPEQIGYLLTCRKSANLFVPNGNDIALNILRSAFANDKKLPSLDILIHSLKACSAEEIVETVNHICRENGLSLPPDRILITWDEAAEMSRRGVSFGSHGATHRILTHLGRNAVDEELKESLAQLAAQDVNMLPVLAYPNGNYTVQIASAAYAAGYRAAVSTCFGAEDSRPDHPYELKRISMHQDITATKALLAWHLSGWERTIKALMTR